MHFTFSGQLLVIILGSSQTLPPPESFPYPGNQGWMCPQLLSSDAAGASVSHSISQAMAYLLIVLLADTGKSS